MAMCKDVWFMDRKINVVGKVERKAIPRMVETKNGPTKVCGAFLKDETGEVRLTLWGSDVDRIKNGYKIKIENGMVSEYKDLKRFSTGFLGHLEVLTTQLYQNSIQITPAITVRNY